MKHSPVHIYNLIAFLGVLGAIVTLALAGKATDLAIMTGLVGVLGSFKPWGMMTPDDKGPAGTKDDPLSVQGADDDKKPVAVEPEAEPALKPSVPSRPDMIE